MLHKILVGALVFALCPFLVLCLFSVPQGDDISIYNLVHERGFWGTLSWSYFEWTGRYSGMAAVAGSALAPSDWLSCAVRMALCGVLIGQAGALYFFIRAVTNSSLNAFRALAVTAILLSLYLAQLPSLCEGYYWLTSVCIYQAGTIPFLGLAALATSPLPDGVLGRRFRYLACSLLAASIAGFNELHAVALLFALLPAAAFAWIRGHEKRGLLTVSLVFCAVGLTTTIAAPGNSVREQHFPERHQFWMSAEHAIATAANLSLKWFRKPTLWVAAIALVAAALPWFAHCRARFRLERYSWLLLLLPIPGFVLLAGLCFPCFWAMGGGALPLRVVNVVYLAFLAGFVATLSVWIIFLARTEVLQLAARSWVWPLSLGVFILSVVLSPNHRKVCDDLIWHVGRYNRELAARQDIVQLAKQNAQSDVVVPALTRVPQSIHFSDIGTDPGNWVNQAYAEFYGVSSIRVSE